MKTFLKEILPYNETEKTELESLKKQICNSSELFWYVSSGTDPHPFYLFNDVNVFLYSDYSRKIARKIYKIYSEQKSRNDKLYFSLIYNKEGHNKYGGADILIEKIFPINIFSREKFKEIRQSQCAESEMVKEEYAKDNNDSLPQGFIIQAAQSSHKFIIIFLFFTNTSCYTEIINPFKLKLKYLCSVCDGCGKGGNWECSNVEGSNFFQTVVGGNIQPRFWLTEHNWTGNKYFSTIDRRIETKLWPNGYDAKVKVFEFNKKTEERYTFETNSYKLSLINYNVFACLDSIKENSLFVTSLSLSNEDTAKLERKHVAVIQEKKLLVKGTVARRISWLNQLAKDKGVTNITTTPFGAGDNSPLLNMDEYTNGENLKIKELTIYYIDKNDYADIRTKMNREECERRDLLGNNC